MLVARLRRSRGGRPPTCRATDAAFCDRVRLALRRLPRKGAQQSMGRALEHEKEISLLFIRLKVYVNFMTT